MPNDTKTICERAIKHIIHQGALAYDTKKEVCRLRTSDGLACAVGGVISDENYDPVMELGANPNKSNRTRDAIIASNPDLTLGPEAWPALQTLQQCHDDADDVEDFVSDAKTALAAHHGITVTL
tara:strand:+ start:2645 stop:3016 length:372 start_codon:yes stop_codon:yes gene_type:complete